MISVFIFGIYKLDFKADVLRSIVIAALLFLMIILSIRNIMNFTTRRYSEMDRFFESVKYRDFTQWFNEDSGPKDIRKLHKGFNSINETIKK
jgi:nitrate/nitrite-specific signal transduction histidine kinase